MELGLSADRVQLGSQESSAVIDEESTTSQRGKATISDRPSMHMFMSTVCCVQQACRVLVSRLNTFLDAFTTGRIRAKASKRRRLRLR